VSHTLGDYGAGAPEAGVRRHLDVIRRVTGSRPHTCPWRAYSDPLVAEVMRYVWACDPPNLSAVLSESDPEILHEGIATYRMALLATLGEDAKLRREQAERERAARQAANNR
jgi:hypothetical protein